MTLTSTTPQHRANVATDDTSAIQPRILCVVCRFVGLGHDGGHVIPQPYVGRHRSTVLDAPLTSRTARLSTVVASAGR